MSLQYLLNTHIVRRLDARTCNPGPAPTRCQKLKKISPNTGIRLFSWSFTRHGARGRNARKAARPHVSFFGPGRARATAGNCRS